MGVVGVAERRVGDPVDLASSVFHSLEPYAGGPAVDSIGAPCSDAAELLVAPSCNTPSQNLPAMPAPAPSRDYQTGRRSWDLAAVTFFGRASL